MGSFKLRLEVTPKNFENIAEIGARLKDFSVPFSNIISEWAQGNVRRKFAAGAGAEKIGVDQGLARWEPVSEAYYKQKHGPVVYGDRQLYPDWLMVKTGALMQALGTRGGFAEFINEKNAAFGTPMNEESAAAASGNKEKRPTIFLDRTDKGMIRRELQRYLTLGENYKSLMWATAGRKAYIMKQSREMDINFSGTVK